MVGLSFLFAAKAALSELAGDCGELGSSPGGIATRDRVSSEASGPVEAAARNSLTGVR